MWLSNFANWIRTALSHLRNWKSTPASTSPKPVSAPKSLSNEETSRRALAAQQLLENPLLQEALGALEADVLAQMHAVSLADKDAHTRLILALQMGNAVDRYLWQRIQDGHKATESLRFRGSRLD
jgi:hypothetical protein